MCITRSHELTNDSDKFVASIMDKEQIRWKCITISLKYQNDLDTMDTDSKTRVYKKSYISNQRTIDLILKSKNLSPKKPHLEKSKHEERIGKSNLLKVIQGNILHSTHIRRPPITTSMQEATWHQSTLHVLQYQVAIKRGEVSVNSCNQAWPWTPRRRRWKQLPPMQKTS